MSNILLGAAQNMGKIVQPQNWFAGSKVHGEQARDIGQTECHVHKATDREQELLLKAGPCQSCKFFSLQKGQERLRADRVTQTLMYDLRWNTFVESTDPATLGNCEAKPHALVHRMSTCELYTPVAAHSQVWQRVKALIKREKAEGTLP